MILKSALPCRVSLKYVDSHALAALLRFSFGTLRCWRLRAAANADADDVAEDCMI
jgi:hypothetical protein